MKTLGIIGGISPESTIEYYRWIIATYRQRTHDGSYPALLINSIDLTRMRDLIEASELAALARHLRNEVKKLAQAGADFGLVAANTPHIVFDDLQRESPIPLLSIVEATCAAAKKLGLKKLGLLGTRFTMQGQFYARVFSREGMMLAVPEPVDQDFIHDKYLGELVNGVFLDQTRDGLLAAVDRLTQRAGIQGVILGGTELPLILREETRNGIPFLDTTRIHAEAAVAEMLS